MTARKQRPGEKDDAYIRRSAREMRRDLDRLHRLQSDRARVHAVLAFQDLRFMKKAETNDVRVHTSVRLAPTGTPGKLIGVAENEEAVDQLVASIKAGLAAKHLEIEWEQTPTEEELARLTPDYVAEYHHVVLDGGDRRLVVEPTETPSPPSPPSPPSQSTPQGETE